jgi:hypothetical protein
MDLAVTSRCAVSRAIAWQNTSEAVQTAWRLLTTMDGRMLIVMRTSRWVQARPPTVVTGLTLA